MVSLRTNPANAVGYDRHLFGHPAHAELLESAQFGNLETDIINTPVVVDEYVDPAMPFQSSDRIYRYSRCHLLLPILPPSVELAREYL